MSRALIEEVKQRSMFADTDDQARSIIRTVTDSIVAVASRGDKVAIRGFGTFERKLRAARKARNPRTGEEIKVAETHKLTFSDRTK